MPTRKSLAYSFLDRYASLVIGIGSSMLIARLLTPTEIGIFSVTMVLLAFVATVRDMGAGQYLIQEKNLTTERIRAVWTVQLGLGFALAIIVLLASQPVAVFYGEPRMRDIMLVVALNYAVNPFGSLTYAWLMREMRFESIALMRFASTVAGAIVSAWLAWKGYGPISLAIGSLASTVVNALLAVHFRPKAFPWLPGLSEIKRVLTFGSQMTASSIIAVLSGSAPELLLGKLQDLASVGLFSRASGLVHMFHRLFVDAVSAVCLPWFAKQSREQGGFADPFLKATSYVTAFGWSFCIGIVCLAQPVIRTLYGYQWDQSVDLARLLAIAMAFSVPASLCSTALLSAGAVSTITRTTVISALISICFVAVGASQGLLTLGVLMIVSASINSAIWLRAASQNIGFSFKHFFKVMGKSMAVAALAGVGPLIALVAYGAYPSERIEPLAIGTLVGLAGFLVGLRTFEHPLQEEVMTVWAKVKGGLVRAKR